MSSQHCKSQHVSVLQQAAAIAQWFSDELAPSEAGFNYTDTHTSHCWCQDAKIAPVSLCASTSPTYLTMHICSEPLNKGVKIRRNSDVYQVLKHLYRPGFLSPLDHFHIHKLTAALIRSYNRRTSLLLKV